MHCCAGATPEQQRRWLPRMAEKTVCAYALSEAGSGSDAFSLSTQARPDGDGFVLNGRKLWISNAMEADLFLVFATVNPEAGYRGITAFLVERGTPGFAVGHKEDKMGIRASSTCELLFDDCRVPAENVVGEVGKGYKIAIETLNEGRIGIAAQMLGLAEGAWSLAVKYSKERKQFGKAIAEFQAVQFTLAEMATQIEAARMLVYNAARMKVRRRPLCERSGHCQVVCLARRRGSRQQGRRDLRRLRLRPRLSDGEVLSRRQDRIDLRRHFEHAAGYHWEIDSAIVLAAQIALAARRERRSMMSPKEFRGIARARTNRRRTFRRR